MLIVGIMAGTTVATAVWNTVRKNLIYSNPKATATIDLALPLPILGTTVYALTKITTLL